MMGWRYRSTVLVLFVYGFFAVLAARFAISPLVPNILETFAISKGHMGLALTGMGAAYGILQYPGGMLGDRFGARRVLFLALGTVGVAALGVALSPTFAVVAVFVFLIGGGAGLYFPVAASYVTDYFENDGQVLGAIAAGSSIAGVIAPGLAALIAARYGWRPAMVVMGLLVLPAIGLLWSRVRSRGADNRTDRLRLNPAVGLGTLSHQGVAFVLFVSICLSFAHQSVFAFLPTFLVEQRAFSTEAAGVAFSGMYVLSAGGHAGMGRVSDVTTRGTAVVLSAASAIVGLTFLLSTSGLVTAIIGVVFVGMGLSFGGVINAWFIDHFPDEERGTGLGFVRMLYLLIGSAGNVVTGVLADAAGWTVAYLPVVGFFATVIVGVGVARVRA